MSRPTTANVGSSPPSSSDRAHTHFGTPSTAFTAYSPSIRASGRNDGNKQDTPARPAPSGRRTQLAILPPALDSDLAARQGLSPLAEDFQPCPRNIVHPDQRLGPVLPHGTPIDFFDLLPKKLPAATPVPSYETRRPSVITSFDQGRNVQLSTEVSLRIGTFSNDQVAFRSFEIDGLNNANPDAIVATFSPKSYPSLTKIDLTLLLQGYLRLEFDGLSDAKQAFAISCSLKYASHAPFVGPGTEVNFLSPRQLVGAAMGPPADVSDFGGQFILTLVPLSQYAQPPSFDQLLATLNHFGPIVALHSVKCTVTYGMSFRVEFDNLTDANVAFDGLDRAVVDDICYEIRKFQPDLDRDTGAEPVGRAVCLPSPTGRSTLSSQERQLSLAMIRQLQASQTTSNGASRSHGNAVDASRIRMGMDVRTTIMLRNIPNKIDQAGLKRYLDQTSLGKYDFMYLRIDFANKCNVGYAFVNFIDATSVAEFAEARSGQPWGVHDSNKVAEISYATIQGRDCLVQKFRNSSVMLEDASYRPKLYVTIPHHAAGTEEVFPGPDNWSKMRRSIENAETIGLYTPGPGPRIATAPASVRIRRVAPLMHASSSRLPLLPSSYTYDIEPIEYFTAPSTSHGLYAPREGQQYREQQRRRTSQLDRGNPLEQLSHDMAACVLSPVLSYANTFAGRPSYF